MWFLPRAKTTSASAKWVQIFFGDAFQRLHFADAEVVFALGHQSAGQADTVAPAQALRLVQQLCAARKADSEAESGVDLPGAVQIPPGETQLHRAVGIAALSAVEILGLHLLKGTGDEFSVRHGEIERTVQAAEALDALTVTTDHQEQDHDGQQGTVHTVPLDQAPDKDGDGDEEQHTVHVILSAPDIFQSVHKRPPFLNSTHLTTPRLRMQGKLPCAVQFPLVFGKKSAIIKTTIFCGAITGTNRRRFLCP